MYPTSNHCNHTRYGTAAAVHALQLYMHCSCTCSCTAGVVPLQLFPYIDVTLCATVAADSVQLNGNQPINNGRRHIWGFLLYYY